MHFGHLGVKSRDVPLLSDGTRFVSHSKNRGFRLSWATGISDGFVAELLL